MRYFTVKEANNTLPLVKRIVEDILEAVDRMKELYKRGEEENMEELKLHTDRLFDYGKELDELGCIFKDSTFEIGLVDFPAIIDGKEVELCWRIDESEIRYYHVKNDGYTGRKPIPVEYLS